MKKMVLGFLLLSGVALSASSQDKKNCDMVEDALLRGHINFRWRQGSDCGKRTSETVVHHQIPASFTSEKANACKCCMMTEFLKDKPSTGDMVNK